MNAWVIESENGMFIGESRAGWDTPRLGWVSGHENALRMARREDAEALERVCRAMGIGFHDKAKGVTEHIWTDAEKASETSLAETHAALDHLLVAFCQVRGFVGVDVLKLNDGAAIRALIALRKNFRENHLPVCAAFMEPHLRNADTLREDKPNNES